MRRVALLAAPLLMVGLVGCSQLSALAPVSGGPITTLRTAANDSFADGLQLADTLNSSGTVTSGGMAARNASRNAHIGQRRRCAAMNVATR